MSDRKIVGLGGRGAVEIAHGAQCVSLVTDFPAPGAVVLAPAGARALAVALIEQAAASESVPSEPGLVLEEPKP